MPELSRSARTLLVTGAVIVVAAGCRPRTTAVTAPKIVRVLTVSVPEALDT